MKYFNYTKEFITFGAYYVILAILKSGYDVYILCAY